MKRHLLTMTAILFIGVAAYAQTAPRTDGRQKVQRARIAEGRQNGEVTRRETVALRKQQRGIRRTERRAEADGTVTVREQRRIDRRQNRASRTIRRAKHNELDRNPNN